MCPFELAWTRTRILKAAKLNARRVARMIGWNVPGVEAAILNNILLSVEPETLARDIVEALEAVNDQASEIPALPD